MRTGRMLAFLAWIGAGASGPAEAQIAVAEPEYTGEDRIEKWTSKTILVVTPHPDDDTFTSGGTLAMLARNGNDISILIYTSDNAGSNDPRMTKERLAEIRALFMEPLARLGFGEAGVYHYNLHSFMNFSFN